MIYISGSAPENQDLHSLSILIEQLRMGQISPLRTNMAKKMLNMAPNTDLDPKVAVTLLESLLSVRLFEVAWGKMCLN